MFCKTEFGAWMQDFHSGRQNTLPESTGPRQRDQPDKRQQQDKKNRGDEVQRPKNESRQRAVHGNDTTAMTAETDEISQPECVELARGEFAALKTL